MKRLCTVLVLGLLASCGGGDDPAIDAMVPPPDAGEEGDAAPPDAGGASGTCANPAQAGATQAGDTTGDMSTQTGSCTGDMARDHVYSYTPPGTAPTVGTLTIDLLTTVDLGVYVRTACADSGTEAGCTDLTFGDEQLVLLGIPAGEELFIIVDGYTAADMGMYTLNVSYQAEVCGDGVVTGGETCDDGGVQPLDGCDATCQVEPDVICMDAIVGTIGTTISGTTAAAQPWWHNSCTLDGSPTAIYSIMAPGAGDLVVSVSSATDHNVAVRTDCEDPGTELDCRGDFPRGTALTESVTVPVAGGEALSVLVSATSEGDGGPFMLDIAFLATTCGDGAVRGFEDCEPPSTATCAADCSFLPEAVCGNLRDDDADGLLDCGDDTACVGTAGCVAGAGAVGTACTANTACAATGGDPSCLIEEIGWPGGYCSEQCADGVCPAGSTCLFYLGQSFCIDVCTAVGDCRSGYDCIDPGVGESYCLPNCMSAADCPSAGSCNADTGFCHVQELACTNGLDDNGDLVVDCADNDCEMTAACLPATFDEVEPNDAQGTATAHPAGGVRTGRIDPAGDMDWWAVTVPGPSSLLFAEVHDNGTGACSSLTIDSEIEILDSTGVSLAFGEDIDGLSNWCSRAWADDLAAGTYYVRVASSQFYDMNGRFPYQLEVVVAP